MVIEKLEWLKRFALKFPTVTTAVKYLVLTIFNKKEIKSVRVP
jgi:hypothetical protein